MRNIFLLILLPDLEIMTPWKWKFKQDLFGLMFKDFQNYKIESDDLIERYIVPLDAIETNLIKT